MKYNREEFEWYCPHCGKTKFAWLGCYKWLKQEVTDHLELSKEEFKNRYIEYVWPLVEKAWDKAHNL